MAQATADLYQRTPQQVFAHHGEALGTEDLDAMLQDYAETACVITPGAVTCGKEGMMLFEKDREPVHIHSRAKQVFDVSGAGDTVLAVLGLAMASGLSCGDAARLANTAAGIVVGKVGTATVTPDELVEALESEELTSECRDALRDHVKGS